MSQWPGDPKSVLFKLLLQFDILRSAWWRHQMEIFSVLLALYAGISPITGEFPALRPVTRSFDVFFDLSLNKRLSKRSLRLVIWDAIVFIMTSP